MQSCSLIASLALCVFLLSSSSIPGSGVSPALAHPQEYIQASFDNVGTFSGAPDFQPFEAGNQPSAADAEAGSNDDSSAQGNNQRNGKGNNNQATATQGRNGPKATGSPGKKGKEGKGKKGKQQPGCQCTATRSSGKKGGGMRPTQPATTGVFDGDRGKKAAKTVTAIPSPTNGAGKKKKSGEARGNEAAEAPQATETPVAAPKVEEQSANPAPPQPADAGQQKQAAKNAAPGERAVDRRVVMAAMVGGMAVFV